MMFGQTDISAIQFNEKSRDDMPKILGGFRLYTLILNCANKCFSFLKRYSLNGKMAKEKLILVRGGQV